MGVVPDRRTVPVSHAVRPENPHLTPALSAPQGRRGRADCHRLRSPLRPLGGGGQGEVGLVVQTG